MRSVATVPVGRQASRLAKDLAKRFAALGGAAMVGRSVAVQAARRQGGASLGKRIVSSQGSRQALPSLARKVQEPAKYLARAAQGGISLGCKAALKS